MTLRADGLRIERGGRTVLSDVSIEVERGEVLAVLGPNGAGKSTLLAGLSGLLPPSEGRVDHEGRIAMALQTPALARRSARANVEAALAWWGVPSEERRGRALEALRDVGVADLAERSAQTLSGGEARRVHLARVLALDPDILLLDEPFAGLDVRARGDLLYDTQELLASSTRATVLVLHDRAEAWALADRVAVMLDGRIAAQGPPGEVFGAPPTPEVAAFVGFAGQIEEPGAVRMLRPQDVELDGDGPLRGRVMRLMPVEDGVRVELSVDDGRVVALAPAPGPELGTEVSLRLRGGVRFPR
jgi:ABC-type cobalamin/Fe3+-siderophores transport system ATPase subunit